MNSTILVLTLRQLLGKRRALFMIVIAALPVVVTVIFRLADPDVSPQRWTANRLLAGLIIHLLQPLTTLVFGATALGMEIEDGTIVYLLAKPLRRFDVIVSKLTAAWLPAAALLTLSTIVSTIIALGSDNSSILIGFTIAIVLGSLVYCCIFLALSVFTNHALIAGLIVIGVELLTVVLSVDVLGVFMSVIPIVLAVGWLMLRVWAFANNGIFFSNKLNIRSFPLVAPHLGLAPVPVEATSTVPLTTTTVEEPAATTNALHIASDAPLNPLDPPAAVIAITPNVSEPGAP